MSEYLAPCKTAPEAAQAHGARIRALPPLGAPPAPVPRPDIRRATKLGWLSCAVVVSLMFWLCVALLA